MRFTPGKLALSFLSILLFAFAITVISQDLDNVSIGGKVTDPNGAPIVGATVTAKLAETNAERTMTTNDDGRFLIVNLKPGSYKIKVAANGFGTKELTIAQTISGLRTPLG